MDYPGEGTTNGNARFAMEGAASVVDMPSGPQAQSVAFIDVSYAVTTGMRLLKKPTKAILSSIRYGQCRNRIYIPLSTGNSNLLAEALSMNTYTRPTCILCPQKAKVKQEHRKEERRGKICNYRS